MSREMKLIILLTTCICLDVVEAQQFKQFVFPEGSAHLASALDDAADRADVMRGSVVSFSVPVDAPEGPAETENEREMNEETEPQVATREERDEPTANLNDPGRMMVGYPINSRISYPTQQQQQVEQIQIPADPNVYNPNVPYTLPEQPQFPQEPYYPPPVEQQPQPIPYAPAPQPPPSGAKQPYEINFCDPREFPESKLTEYGMEKINYFIYNKTCSGTFFQCSIGQTYLFTCLTEDQAFDPSIVNCNYRYDNRICPDYDHITHCTIKETCTENQFACCAHPQKCIDLSRRCDGHNDCVDAQDENDCPSCSKNEFACVKSGKCIASTKRCDGNQDDCQDGSNLDEFGCSKNSTCWGKFVCDSQETLATLGHSECVDYELHCDGQKDCPGGEDEVNCRQSTGAKYLLCENQKQSVLKEQWCDGQEHCADASDEKYCY